MVIQGLGFWGLGFRSRVQGFKFFRVYAGSTIKGKQKTTENELDTGMIVVDRVWGGDAYYEHQCYL